MEALAFASWLKRIVEIEIEEDENGKLIVTAIKSSVSVGDVLLFERKVKLYEKKEARIGPFPQRRRL